MRSAAGQALAGRIEAFVRRGTSLGFGELAMAIHAHQLAHDPVVAALSPPEVTTWRDIPAVPVTLFKQLSVGTVPRGQGRVFRTSGTTRGLRGEHRMWSTDLYDLGATAWARSSVQDLPVRTHALLLDPSVHPDSSLSHMVAELSDEADWYLGFDGLDLPRLRAGLANANEPVFLPATAFALSEWLEHGVGGVPEGSVIMVTGGFKGRHRRLEGDDLLAAARRAFPGCRLVTEYGMTELSSQLWGEPGGPFHPPPWLRAVAVDPVSGVVLECGQSGQLRFVDLCNLDGTVAIETLDQGIVQHDGSVVLEGRLSGSAARGCSLTVEETWARRQP